MEPTREQLSELGRALAAARKRKQGVCEMCGTPFEGYSKKRYCSHKCVVRAGRLAKRQAREREMKGEQG